MEIFRSIKRARVGFGIGLLLVSGLAGCLGKTDPEPAADNMAETSEIVSLDPRASVTALNAKTRAAIQTRLTKLLAAQDNAWNRGDIEGFMSAYWDAGELRFASGGAINRGWQATLDGYRARYPDQEAMGKLSFSNLEIKVLSPHFAQVFGRWRLVRDKDTPGGLFTLLFQKIDGQWKIISDHTSSE